MEAESSPRMFHKLIRAQRTSSTSQTLFLVVNDEKLIGEDDICEDDICEGWARPFQFLAIQAHSSDFDDEFLD